ncbi:hypothetical protein [Rickettsia tamurae]|uniref:hypothetical protein n=1 Tax=Rickettsia tamurae TaxID=334545 RepID=UPI001BFDF2BF|nr:hypothetical protein [Rickettsia tamurae]
MLHGSFMSFSHMRESSVVIPRLDRGIQKYNLKILKFSIFNWTPWSSHGVTVIFWIPAFAEMTYSKNHRVLYPTSYSPYSTK